MFGYPSDYLRRKRRQDRRRKQRERQRRRRREREEKEAALEEALQKDPTFGLAELLDEGRRDEMIERLGRRRGDWALEHSKLAALAVIERDELTDLSVGGTSVVGLACRHWPSVARRVVENQPHLLHLPQTDDEGDGRRVAHTIAYEHEDLAEQLTDTPEKAQQTYGGAKAVLFSALRWGGVRARVTGGPPAYARIRDADGEPAAHRLARECREAADMLLGREDVWRVEDAAGVSLVEGVLGTYPDLIFEHLSLATERIDGGDPLLHVAAAVDGAVADRLADLEDDEFGPWAARIFGLPSARGVPLVHRFLERDAVARRALEDDAVGRIPGPNGQTARRAALGAHPGPVNAWRAARGAWRDWRGDPAEGEKEDEEVVVDKERGPTR